jgi:HlyD family secretion protein
VVCDGSVVFTLAGLKRLTSTVCVPEDRTGKVILGIPAGLSVESFPGATFRATVTHIADYAGFSSLNVQTVEGRRTVLFVVKPTLIEGIGGLKPGMPADVTFGVCFGVTLWRTNRQPPISNGGCLFV